MPSKVKTPRATKTQAPQVEPKQPDATTKNLLSEKELRFKALSGTVGANDTTKSGRKAYLTQTVDLSSNEIVRSSIVVSKPKFNLFDALVARQSGQWLHKGKQIRAFTVKANGEYIIKSDGKTVTIEELKAI